MKIYSNSFSYNSIAAVDIARDKYSNDAVYLFITVSGYETRSRFYSETNIMNNNNYKYFYIFNYIELSKKYAREQNDAFFSLLTPTIHTYQFNKDNQILQDIASYITNIKKTETKKLIIDIDISSMPRFIYCSLPILCEHILSKGDHLRVIYSIGKYNPSKFPTYGISDFELFSGKMSLSPVNRTHIIGLSFDSIKTEGIINTLDPRYLITFYTNPAANDYDSNIMLTNCDIIEQSDLSFAVPFHDVEETLSKLISICNDLKEYSDICIIPDGPKTIILLASLIPNIIGTRGIVCFHVQPNRSRTIPPEDTLPTGEILSFEFIK